MKKNMTYEEAVGRLEQIVTGFEQDHVELDKLTTQLAEARQLIKFCNDKLTKAEADVNKLLDNEQE